MLETRKSWKSSADDAQDARERSFNTERVLSIPMEMKVSEDEYTLSALPARYDAEDVSIQFNNGVLTLMANTATQDENVRPCSPTSPRAIQPLGRDRRPVVREKIEASMKDGVLTIHSQSGGSQTAQH